MAYFGYVYGLFGDFYTKVALQIYTKHGHCHAYHCAGRARSQSDGFSPGTAWNSIATRSASASSFCNWQGNSSPAFLSAVTPSLPITSMALDVRRISFAGFNSDSSECNVIDLSTWLGLQVSGISLLQGKGAVFECHTQLHDFREWFGYW